MSLDVALRDYKDYGQDVANSSFSTLPNNLKRFVSLFDQAEPLGQIAAELLPAIDFDAWYQQALATGGSMVGSGRLDWPVPRREKVTYQLELLRRIASDEIHLTGFFTRFCWAGNHLDRNTSKLIREIFQPFHRDFLRTLEAAMPRATQPGPRGNTTNLVDDERIDQLQALPRTSFDYTRLIRICQDLNIAYRQGAYHAVAALTRALLDHVPPIFEARTFAEVANNYAGGKSFKEAMDHLQNSARKIGDAVLHTQIRGSEVLPVATQVNFSNSLDFLLSEIVRIAK